MAVFSAMVSAKELCAIFEQRLVAHQDSSAADFARIAERLHLTADSLHTLPALGFAEVVTLDAELADALAFCDAEVLDPVTGCRKALVRTPGTEWQLVGVVSCGHQLQPESLLPPLLTDADVTGLITGCTCSVGTASATTTATTSGAGEVAGLSAHCSCTATAAAAGSVPLVWRWAASVVGATLPAELFTSASAAAATATSASKTGSAGASAINTAVHSFAAHNRSNDDGACGVEWTLKTGGGEASERGGSLLAPGRGVERDGKVQHQQARENEQTGKEGKEGREQQEDQDEAEDDEGTAVLVLLALPPQQQQPQQPQQQHGTATATQRPPALTSFKSATSDGDRTTRAAGGLRSLARAAHLGLSASFTARGVATSKWVVNHATGSLAASSKVAAMASGSAASLAAATSTCNASVATDAIATAAPPAAAAACSALGTLDQKVRLGARKLAALARMILSPPPQRPSTATATTAATSAATKARMSCNATLRAATTGGPRKGLSAVSMPLPRVQPLALPLPAMAVVARANLLLDAPAVAPFLAHSVPLMSH